MGSADLQKLKEELVRAGLEIYRTRPQEIQVAERVRLHIMDSGIRVRVGPSISVVFTARSQRSDFPSHQPDELFGKVREIVGKDALSRGYHEEGHQSVDVRDPVDADRILDTWHEVTYAKDADAADVVDEVRWALAIDKFVTR